MNCRELITFLETEVPLEAAEGWDNPGFLVGDKDKEIKKVLVVLDITNEVVDYAIDQKADFILANPPFNYSPWGQDKLMEDVRWKYGIPPASNANFAWIQHMIHHLAPGGKIGLVLANGALSSQSGGEGEIRKKIIEDDLIEGIIAMPTQLFYSVH